MSRAQVHSALPLISASQISKFRECQRKWAWAYIAKIQTPTHPSALLGTEVHDTQLGPYLTKGRPFDFTRESGYIAAALLEYLPQPKVPGLEIEKHFILPSPAGQGKFAYQGYIDLYLSDSAAAPGLPGGAPLVGDFKTTGNLDYAKGVKALAVDVQAMLYATNALFETKVNVVDLSWMYAHTKGSATNKKSKRTYLRVGEEQVIEQFKAIEVTALELFDAKQSVTDPLSLPPSPSQCEAYGGCPYRDKCNLSPLQHLEALSARDFSIIELQKEMPMSESSTSSLMANLRAKKAGAQGVAAASQSAIPAEQGAGSSPASVDAPSPSPSPEPLGINPPEKDLPPPEPAKRGPGRPRKPKPEEQIIEATIEDPKQLELPLSVSALTSLDYEKLAYLIVDQLVSHLARGAK